MMRKCAFLFAMCAMLLALAIPAKAGTLFDYTFNSGPVTATGTLTGNLVAAGQYNIVGGSISLTDLTNPALNGTGIFVPMPANGNFYTGGGTILSFGSGANSYLFPEQDPEIDSTNGALLFRLTSGPGALSGEGVYIGAAGPGDYQMFAGNWGIVDWHGGSFSATASSVPEPATFALMGLGLIGLGTGIKRKLATANN